MVLMYTRSNAFSSHIQVYLNVECACAFICLWRWRRPTVTMAQQ